MSNVRNSRIRLLTATAAAAIAALSLTACGDGSGVRGEGASATSTADPGSSSHDDANSALAGSEQDADEATAKTPETSKDAGSRTIGTSDAESGDSAASGSGKNDSGTSDDKTVTCQGSNTKTVAAPLKRPLNHMLLTVTNTGSDSCHLYGYPALRFSQSQSVPPVVEDSLPQAVVTLAPGESGYASVNLSAADGSGSDGYTAKSLIVHFQGRTAHEGDLATARPSLPAKGVFIDSSLKVTYWQQSMEDAIKW